MVAEVELIFKSQHRALPLTRGTALVKQELERGFSAAVLTEKSNLGDQMRLPPVLHYHIMVHLMRRVVLGKEDPNSPAPTLAVLQSSVLRKHRPQTWVSWMASLYSWQRPVLQRQNRVLRSSACFFRRSGVQVHSSKLQNLL